MAMKKVMVSWVAAMVMLPMVSLVSASTIEASWPAEYIFVQGYFGFHYLYAPDSAYNPSETENALTWSNSGTWVGGNGGVAIHEGMVLPGDTYGAGVHDAAVLRWVSDVNSDLQLAGSFNLRTTYPDGTSGVNGVFAVVRVNGVDVWSEQITNSDATIHSYDITVPNVAIGDDIDFLVAAGWHNYLDETYMSATITSVPEPATLGLLLIGLMSIIRRKK